VLDAVRFGGQGRSVATGRCPDGSDQLYRLQSQTPGASNAGLLVSDVVLNEIMFHPISEDDNDQYIELHNRSAASVDLTGWRLAGGVSFTFPAGAVVEPGGYVVVGRTRAC